MDTSQLTAQMRQFMKNMDNLVNQKVRINFREVCDDLIDAVDEAGALAAQQAAAAADKGKAGDSQKGLKALAKAVKNAGNVTPLKPNSKAPKPKREPRGKRKAAASGG